MTGGLQVPTCDTIQLQVVGSSNRCKLGLLKIKSILIQALTCSFGVFSAQLHCHPFPCVSPSCPSFPSFPSFRFFLLGSGWVRANLTVLLLVLLCVPHGCTGVENLSAGWLTHQGIDRVLASAAQAAEHLGVGMDVL